MAKVELVKNILKEKIIEKGADAGCMLRTIQVYRSDKKEIAQDDLIKLTHGVMKKYAYAGSCSIKAHADEFNNISIKGLRPDRWSTLKSWDETMDNIELEDYLNGRVLDNTKFSKYYQLQITIKLRPGCY